MAAAARPVTGVEISIPGSDKVQWVEVTVPSSSATPSPPPFRAEGSRSAAGFHIVAGDPDAYLIWRLHKATSNVLEIIELFSCKEFPQIGLRLIFEDVLFPFAFLCKKEIQNGEGSGYTLYVLTISGVAYLLNLRTPFSYLSGSTFPQDDLLEFDVQNYSQSAKITAVAALSGCLVTGRQDGSVSCCQLGLLHPSSPGFIYDVRDDVGIGRLWNLMSRGKTLGPVHDMFVSELCGRMLLFVLHADGNLRIWDLISHTKVVSQSINSDETEGTTPWRLWVGYANYETNMISLAVLHTNSSLSDTEMVAVHHFTFDAGDKILLTPEYTKTIHLGEGTFVDLKLGFGKLWILKEDGPMLYDLTQSELDMECRSTYSLQEDFVAEQLFQTSEVAFDDLMWTSNSIFSSSRDQATSFVSSLLLRRLLQPGIHQSYALRATLLEHKKYLSEHEFETLTLAGLKKEILATIEAEGSATSSEATLYYWKSFCAHYFQHWCQDSAPYSLFLDSSRDLVGLIRKSSISFFRPLEATEQLIYGFSFEAQAKEGSGAIFLDDGIDAELLFEVLRCMSGVSHQLGGAAPALFYESLLCSTMSSDDIISQLLKMMEVGYNPPLASSLIQQVGIDATWEKKQISHKVQRKFAVDMLLSFNTLCSRASNWAGVLDVVEKYLKFLNPQKTTYNSGLGKVYNVNSSILIEATSQVARLMFESTFDVLLLLGYVVNASGMIHMLQSDVARIRGKLIPMIQEILNQWLIVHFVVTTSTTQPTVEDFSSCLSSLHIGKKTNRTYSDEKLGSLDFTLANLLELPILSESNDLLSSKSLPNPTRLNKLIESFCNLIVGGFNREESPSSSSPTIELASLFLCHGQYEAAEDLFAIIDNFSRSRKRSLGQSTHEDSSARLHLLGFCLLLRAHSGSQGVLKQQKLREAIRCFFRAASSNGASKSLHHLPLQTGFQPPGKYTSPAIWRLHYYQWAMQTFEQYGMSEGACQFALAALEQVDVVELNDLLEPATMIRGRLWANVFKFTLDLKSYRDAYCAIISNPDEDSKYTCLRRFIIVLCEHGAMKVLCDGKLPFVGLMDKVEQELVWKAERSDIFSKPNIYKLLYAFEAHRNNWRKAASYMYRYSVRLKNEVSLDGPNQVSAALQERLHALSTTINALQLVDRAYAWIEPQYGNNYDNHVGSPNKKSRSITQAAGGLPPQLLIKQPCIDVEMLEKEYLLTSAEHVLSLMNDKFKITGSQTLHNLVDALVQQNFYDMAFTIIIKFWKGSELKRELERVFVVMSQKCCPNRVGYSFKGSGAKTSNLLLTFSEDDMCTDGMSSPNPANNELQGNGDWDTLELYLDKYKELHSRLPVTVAETLLYTDHQVELPLWLVHMFKGGRRATSWGMIGPEADPATLFRLYVDYGRHAEATNLLLEYLESFASLRPADIMNRKKMSAIWFPYTAIDRLWGQLEEIRSSGHMVDQCVRLKKLLQNALMNHLKKVEADSNML